MRLLSIALFLAITVDPTAWAAEDRSWDIEVTGQTADGHAGAQSMFLLSQSDCACLADALLGKSDGAACPAFQRNVQSQMLKIVQPQTAVCFWRPQPDPVASAFAQPNLLSRGL